MHFDVLTLFPEAFSAWQNSSIVARACESKKVSIAYWNIRDFSTDPHHKVDDAPYGGGAGMVMSCQPLVDAIEAVKVKAKPDTPVIYLSPTGERLTQISAEKWAQSSTHFILVCGHYEGIDQRVRDHWIDAEISIGDFVLTGGELPAQVLMEVLLRLSPGVLGGGEDSWQEESFSPRLNRQKEYPHYTRPEVFRGHAVPPVLLSGHHQKIQDWRHQNLG